MLNSSKDYIGQYKKIVKCQTKLNIKGTSGGFITTVLIMLLRNKLIDGAILVDSKGMHCFPRIAKTEEDIAKCAGSKYQKISVLSVLKKLDKKKKYALVALPCHIRQLEKISSELIRPIYFRIGLFCGFNLEKKTVGCLAHCLGIEFNNIDQVCFRGGKFPGGFTIKTSNGHTISLPKSFYTLVNKMFIPEKCLCCDDLTAEYADLSVGDAWEETAFSRVILRNDRALNVLQVAKDVLLIKNSGFDDIIETQWHLLQYKKHGVEIRKKYFGQKYKVKMGNYEKLISYYYLGEILFFKKFRAHILKLNIHQLLTLNKWLRKFDMFLGKWNKKAFSHLQPKGSIVEK